MGLDYSTTQNPDLLVCTSDILETIFRIIIYNTHYYNNKESPSIVGNCRNNVCERTSYACLDHFFPFINEFLLVCPVLLQ